MSEQAQNLLKAIWEDKECNCGASIYAELVNNGYIKLYGITWTLTQKGEAAIQEMLQKS